MKVRKTIVAAMLLGGSVGISPGLALSDGVVIRTREEVVAYRPHMAERDYGWRAEMSSPHERYPKKIEDDSSLAPGVPGVTEENSVNIAGSGALMVEEALADRGYRPRSIDGTLDIDTRHAIRAFQRDHGLVVTGNVDRETAMLLGVPVSESA